MNYFEELRDIEQIVPRVKRAIQRLAFDLRAGTEDQQLFFDAVFSNRTRFTAAEAALLAWHFSWGDNDLNVLGASATDAQIQICVNAIQNDLIARQTSRAGVTGLG